MQRFSLSFFALLLLTTAVVADRPAYFGFGFTYHPPLPNAKDRRGWMTVRITAPGSPAERAGLKPGDLITAIAGQPLTFKTDLDVLQRLAAFRPSERLKLTILRDRKTRQVQVIGVPMSDRQYDQWKANMDLARDSTGIRRPPG